MRLYALLDLWSLTSPIYVWTKSNAGARDHRAHPASIATNGTCSSSQLALRFAVASGHCLGFAALRALFHSGRSPLEHKEVASNL